MFDSLRKYIFECRSIISDEKKDRFFKLQSLIFLLCWIFHTYNWSFLYGPDGLSPSMGFINGLYDSFNILHYKSELIHSFVLFSMYLCVYLIYVNKYRKAALICTYIVLLSMSGRVYEVWNGEQGSFSVFLPYILLLSTKPKTNFYLHNLFKIQLALVYIISTPWKVYTDYDAWINGSLLSYALADNFFSRFWDLELFSYWGGFLSRITTWFVFILEATWGILLLTNSYKKLLPPLAIALCIFHIGIFFFLEGVSLFGLTPIPLIYLALDVDLFSYLKNINFKNEIKNVFIRSKNLNPR